VKTSNLYYQKQKRFACRRIATAEGRLISVT
jgi:hypothetical protein